MVLACFSVSICKSFAFITSLYFKSIDSKRAMTSSTKVKKDVRNLFILENILSKRHRRKKVLGNLLQNISTGYHVFLRSIKDGTVTKTHDNQLNLRNYQSFSAF